MDIFGRQESTKRRTAILTVYLVLGVLGTIVSFHLLVTLSAAAFEQTRAALIDRETHPIDEIALRPKLLLGSTILILFLVGVGVLNRWNSIKWGGAKLAEHFDGLRVSGPQMNPRLQQLQNTVEEMAIAAGLPVPAVFVFPTKRESTSSPPASRRATPLSA